MALRLFALSWRVVRKTRIGETQLKRVAGTGESSLSSICCGGIKVACNKGGLFMSVIEDYYKTMDEVRSEYARKYADKPYIYNDGVLRPDLYFVSDKPKIVMLLKEGIDNWSLIDKIENTKEDNYHVEFDRKNSSKSWASNIIKPVYYVQNKQWLNNTRNHSVTGFAYINIKKVAEWNPNSDDDDLDGYVKNDKDLLYKEITACVPDIVFCCQGKKDRRLDSPQLIRLEKILGTKRERIDDISFAYKFSYQVNGRENKLIAVNWSHPSRSVLKNVEMHQRLEQLVPVIEETVRNNNLPRVCSEETDTI